MKILIEKFNPGWKELFELEKIKFKNSFPKLNFSVEHIGSTSVEGLGAKPIIDILIGLEDLKIAESLVNKIEALDYRYISEYNSIIPDRRFFQKEKFHLHVVQTNSDIWNRHISFRDYLRADDQTRNEYYLLKKKLSLQDWKDGNEYAVAKTEFIKSVEEKAKLLTSL